MRLAILFLSMVLFSIGAYCQQTIVIQVKDESNLQPIQGASIVIKDAAAGTATDSLGFASLVLPATNKLILIVSYIGYAEKSINLSSPFPSTLAVVLEPEEEEEEAVVVRATRTSRSIANSPTRIEVISGEELDEKSNMKPGELRMLLGESTGIQVQQTSATSYNSTFRIQGLEGRYTQLLKDGFPLYGGFSGGLSIMQIPPLDLKQVEVIKGSASTLYGGGAIAGLINLVSKAPSEDRQLNFHINGTTAGGLDLNGFYSKRHSKTGITLFTSRNSSNPYDPSDIGLTAIPAYERYTINPKLFYYFTDRTTVSLGVNLNTEWRTGGDIEFIKGNKTEGYFEKNNTDRFATQLAFDHNVDSVHRISFKNSVSIFKRHLHVADYRFEGKQLSSFSEVSYAYTSERFEWITGLNYYTDKFTETNHSGFPVRDYSLQTFGIFAQNTVTLTPSIDLETGLRADYIKEFGWALLPRFSALFKISNKLSSRVGAGFGYKTPDMFTEDAEALHFRMISPINYSSTLLERSWGLNADINYRTVLFDEVNLSLNNLIYYTRLTHPLVLDTDTPGNPTFSTATGHIDTKGLETNLRLGYEPFTLFLGYTYTDTRKHFDDEKTFMPLTAKHKVNMVLMFEMDEKWKLGAEAYYFGSQYLNDETKGQPYWITGFMVERLWEKISLYINFENYTDTRQTKFGPIYTGSLSEPIFNDIYAPLDGFVVNGGVKVRVF